MKIYLSEFESYKNATESQFKSIGRSRHFDLDRLPTAGMQREMEAFIRSRTALTYKTLSGEVMQFNRICRFLQEKAPKVKSVRERDVAKWDIQLKAWMVKQGYQLTEKRFDWAANKQSDMPSKLIRYMQKFIRFHEPEDTRDEKEKDIWELSKIGIPVRENPIKNFKTLNFTRIIQPDIREEVKKVIFMHLKYEALDSVNREISAMNRLSEYLKQRFPEIESCGELNRDIFEKYLMYLNTEDTGRNNYLSELGRLRAILESMGKIYPYPQLEHIFYSSDMPKGQPKEFNTYSDEEMKRLNAKIVEMDEQTARLLIIHQMLGTRISDTLTLKPDCIYEKDGRPIIRIHQMKTNTYEKPVSEELKALIQKATDYTKEKYGETSYIFVSRKNPEKPVQYSALRYQVLAMIHREGLRDDNGKLFGFGTHMFRHYYGMKLAEMHLDDWTIARLLGHSTMKNVPYYRKMSGHVIEEETREVRQMMDEILLNNLEGWGEEYEQIRQNGGRK